MAENLVTKKINTLTIDSLTLGLVLPVDSLYLQNVYVDVDDTHIRTAAFNFSAALVDGSALIDLPASSVGSIYHLQLLNAGAQVLSVFFAMPMQDILLSELDLYTAYPPREGYPLQSPLWGEIEGAIANQLDLTQTFMSKGDGTALSDSVQQQITQGQQTTNQSITTIDGRVTGVDDKLKLLFVTSTAPKVVNGVTIPAGTYLDVQTHVAKESITGDRIVKGAQLNEPKLSATYDLTTLDAPNIVLAADGTLRTTTRKAGILENDLVVRGADGYPTNNNAIGVGQTWQDVKANRVSGTIYTNSTGRPIQVLFTGGKQATPFTDFYINGVLVSSWGGTESDESSICVIIPNGNNYKYVNAPNNLFQFWELR